MRRFLGNASIGTMVTWLRSWVPMVEHPPGFYRVIFWTESKVYEKFTAIFLSLGAKILGTCSTRWGILFGVLNVEKAHRMTTIGPLHWECEISKYQPICVKTLKNSHIWRFLEDFSKIGDFVDLHFVNDLIRSRCVCELFWRLIRQTNCTNL